MICRSIGLHVYSLYADRMSQASKHDQNSYLKQLPEDLFFRTLCFLDKEAQVHALLVRSGALSQLYDLQRSFLFEDTRSALVDFYLFNAFELQQCGTFFTKIQKKFCSCVLCEEEEKERLRMHDSDESSYESDDSYNSEDYSDRESNPSSYNDVSMESEDDNDDYSDDESDECDESEVSEDDDSEDDNCVEYRNERFLRRIKGGVMTPDIAAAFLRVLSDYHKNRHRCVWKYLPPGMRSKYDIMFKDVENDGRTTSDEVSLDKINWQQTLCGYPIDFNNFGKTFPVGSRPAELVVLQDDEGLFTYICPRRGVISKTKFVGIEGNRQNFFLNTRKRFCFTFAASLPGFIFSVDDKDLIFNNSPVGVDQMEVNYQKWRSEWEVILMGDGKVEQVYKYHPRCLRTRSDLKEHWLQIRGDQLELYISEMQRCIEQERFEYSVALNDRDLYVAADSSQVAMSIAYSARILATVLLVAEKAFDLRNDSVIAPFFSTDARITTRRFVKALKNCHEKIISTKCIVYGENKLVATIKADVLGVVNILRKLISSGNCTAHRAEALRPRE